jgi:hypothetical protein
MKVLSGSIEEMRMQLVKLAELKGFQDQEVIRLSQRLDVLIFNYLSWSEQDDCPFLAEAM